MGLSGFPLPPVAWTGDGPPQDMTATLWCHAGSVNDVHVTIEAVEGTTIRVDIPRALILALVADEVRTTRVAAMESGSAASVLGIDP